MPELVRRRLQQVRSLILTTDVSDDPSNYLKNASSKHLVGHLKVNFF